MSLTSKKIRAIKMLFESRDELKFLNNYIDIENNLIFFDMINCDELKFNHLNIIAWAKAIWNDEVELLYENLMFYFKNLDLDIKIAIDNSLELVYENKYNLRKFKKYKEAIIYN